METIGSLFRTAPRLADVDSRRYQVPFAQAQRILEGRDGGGKGGKGSSKST